MGTVPPHLQPIIAPHGRGVRRSRAGDSRFARISVRMCYRVMLVALMGVLVGLMFMGQTISAPDWVRQRVTDHLERTLEGHRIAFGDMRFVIRRGWRPRFGRTLPKPGIHGPSAP